MSKHSKSARRRLSRNMAGARLLALLALPALGTAVEAEENLAWRVEPALDIRMATYFEYSGGASMTYPAIGAELSFQLSSPKRPYTVGLFADYELGTLAEVRHTRLLGGWASYRFGRWKLSTVAAHYASNEMNRLWMQASKLQFELRPGHKLAVEAIGVISGDDPAFQFAYSTNLTQHASLSIKLGLGANRMRDIGASTNLVWNVY